MLLTTLKSLFIPHDILGFVLYGIILMDILALSLQKLGTLFSTILVAISIMSALILEVGMNDPQLANGTGAFANFMIPGHLENFLLGLAVLLGILVFTGMTKTGRSRGVGVIGTVLSFVFVAGMWLLHEQ